MSRFVRASKYRHVFGQTGKKEYGIENIKVSNSAWDTNLIACSGKYVSVNWNASGGGAFAILPLPSPFRPLPNYLPYKLPDVIPLARGHTAPVLDTDWNPFDDSVVASGGEDGKLLIWKVEDSQFDGWGADKWVPVDFDPVARVDASPKKIGQVLFHPTASHVVATASGDHVVKLWDLNNTDDPRTVLSGHTDAIQSVAFNPSGTLLATTARDRKIRIFDPRSGPSPVRTIDGHGGIKGARVTWMGDKDNIATTGFSKMSERQLSIWETGGLSNVKTVGIDQSAGVIMPFWSDNGILFLAGKGDGNIRYYEWDSDSLYALSEHKSTEPQRGMCFLPRRALAVSECEIARAYKVSGSGFIEPIAFIVPRRADSFQGDIYPLAPSSEPSLSATEFFGGREVKPKLMSLETGAITSTTAFSTRKADLAPSKMVSAPVPEPAATSTPVFTPSLPSSASAYPEPVSTISATADRQTMPVTASPTDSPMANPETLRSDSSAPQQVQQLLVENEKLSDDLRDARARIRHLELQVEGMKANAQRAAKALLEG